MAPHTDLVPISKARHGHRFWRRFSSYDFARPLAEVPIVAEEILHCASAFPVAFRRHGGGSRPGVTPVALLSLIPDQDSPFVSHNGRWLGTYVPSQLRSHPFASHSTGQGDQRAVLINETSGLITDDPRDEPFFAPDGTLAPGLAQVVQFFSTRTAALQATDVLCATLEAMELFTPLTSHEGVELPPGLLTIDGAALKSLPDAHLVLLARQDGLRLIHAHQVSLQHCLWLDRASRQTGLTKATPDTDTTSPGNDALDGFLSALAQAQENDAMPGQPGEESKCLQVKPPLPEQGLPV
ncbi:SapC family protein [Tropicibacter sp. Alg240-R139]|uniref:SapC family protein n=1 Tax=Tropicibacter sp. Alg240-R139 TaxID=2305991 RepID=UPI0013E0C859|nr:SapC family protein [Tropicibacter sp. Alg240-R139]